jgi:hypothetical protein
MGPGKFNGCVWDGNRLEKVFAAVMRWNNSGLYDCGIALASKSPSAGRRSPEIESLVLEQPLGP